MTSFLAPVKPLMDSSSFFSEVYDRACTWQQNQIIGMEPLSELVTRITVCFNANVKDMERAKQTFSQRLVAFGWEWKYSDMITALFHETLGIPLCHYPSSELHRLHYLVWLANGRPLEDSDPLWGSHHFYDDPAILFSVQHVLSMDASSRSILVRLLFLADGKKPPDPLPLLDTLPPSLQIRSENWVIASILSPMISSDPDFLPSLSETIYYFSGMSPTYDPLQWGEANLFTSLPVLKVAMLYTCLTPPQKKKALTTFFWSLGLECSDATVDLKKMARQLQGPLERANRWGDLSEELSRCILEARIESLKKRLTDAFPFPQPKKSVFGLRALKDFDFRRALKGRFSTTFFPTNYVDLQHFIDSFLITDAHMNCYCLALAFMALQQSQEEQVQIALTELDPGDITEEMTKEVILRKILDQRIIDLATANLVLVPRFVRGDQEEKQPNHFALFAMQLDEDSGELALMYYDPKGYETQAGTKGFRRESDQLIHFLKKVFSFPKVYADRWWQQGLHDKRYSLDARHRFLRCSLQLTRLCTRFEGKTPRVRVIYPGSLEKRERVEIPSAPLQITGHQCGIFVLAHAILLACNIPPFTETNRFRFLEEDMESLRSLVGISILHYLRRYLKGKAAAPS